MGAPIRRGLFALIHLAIWMVVAVLVYARWIEPNTVRVERPGWPEGSAAEALAGVRIVHLADLHISEEGARERRLVREVNALEPDLVLVTGDSAQFYLGTGAARAVLGRFEARYGTFVTLGDADYANREDRCRYCHEADRRTLTARPGVRVLRNGAVTVTIGESTLVIAGVDDASGPCAGRFPELPPETAGAGPRILLSPSPLVLPEAASRGYDFIFTGDTHGGQVRIPGFGPVHRGVESARYGWEGWVSEGGTRMFINRGFGTSYLPFRFGCPPVIACFEAPSPSTGQ